MGEKIGPPPAERDIAGEREILEAMQELVLQQAVVDSMVEYEQLEKEIKELQKALKKLS